MVLVSSSGQEEVKTVNYDPVSSEACSLFQGDSPCFVSLLLGENCSLKCSWLPRTALQAISIMCWPGGDQKYASRMHPATRIVLSQGCRRQKRELGGSSSFLLSLLTNVHFVFLQASPDLLLKTEEGGKVGMRVFSTPHSNWKGHEVFPEESNLSSASPC